ncbi:MAG TPA: c-type cytochrome [Polyangia bacterium]|nr:c-type cytochrome [Polyangia bacterium]
MTTGRNSVFGWRLAVTLMAAAGCMPQGQNAGEGRATVVHNQSVERAVINQPVGPMPGPGDISPLANPLGSDPTARMEGYHLFNQFNCSGCHGGRGGGGMGPSLRDPWWLYGSTADRIFNSIAQGRGRGMPSWGSRIPEKQIWELTAYIQSMRTEDEPEAPR